MTRQELEQAQALVDGITQWHRNDRTINATNGNLVCLLPNAPRPHDEANAAFIAQAPTLVRKLLAEVAKLQAERQAMRDISKPYKEPTP